MSDAEVRKLERSAKDDPDARTALRAARARLRAAKPAKAKGREPRPEPESRLTVHYRDGCPWASGELQCGDTDARETWKGVNCGHCLRRKPITTERERRARERREREAYDARHAARLRRLFR